jgi:hypothetical protein
MLFVATTLIGLGLSAFCWVTFIGVDFKYFGAQTEIMTWEIGIGSVIAMAAGVYLLFRPR